MEKYDAQVARIKKKLAKMKVSDKALNQFGAKTHRYILREPIPEKDVVNYEEQLHITLPEAYKIFITRIGYGGAGPDHGLWIFSPDLFIGNNEFYKDPSLFLPLTFGPDTSNEEWKANTSKFYQKLSLEEEWKEDDRVYGGLSIIGDCGCGTMNRLVMNGEHKGKIVWTPGDCTVKPGFYEEDNFLDWYERWLDESILRDLQLFGVGNFAVRDKKSDEEVIRQYEEAIDVNTRKRCLSALLERRSLAPSVFDIIKKDFAHEDEDIRRQVQALLTKHAYETAKPLLKKFEASYFGEVLNLIYAFADEHAADWKTEIETVLGGNSTEERLIDKVKELKSISLKQE